MPANLNALIRYKQIDLCLRDPGIHATIPILTKKCLERLSLYRGVEDLSERTIREDIRIMRGEYMGFNAPIIVKNGIYTYKDEDYSIFNTSINEMDLLKKVVRLLIEEKENIKNEKLNGILNELSILTGVKIEEEKTEGEVLVDENYKETTSTSYMIANNSNITFNNKFKMSSDQWKKLKEEYEKERKMEEISISKLSNNKSSISADENNDLGMINTQQKPKIYLWDSIFEVL